MNGKFLKYNIKPYVIFAALLAVLSVFLFYLKPILKGLGMTVFSVFGAFFRPAVSYACALVLWTRCGTGSILLSKRFMNKKFSDLIKVY